MEPLIDVYVEGISMLTTQRSEFAAVIDSKGVNGLMDALRERVHSDASDVANP